MQGATGRFGPDDIEPGTTIGGRYVVKGRLARGGMATVYVAADVELPGIEFALKVLTPHLAADPGFVERFRREGQALMLLDHTNILRCHTLVVDDANGLYFLVLKYLTGGTLRERLQEGQPWGVMDALDVLGPVAEALDYAHSVSRPVVHRDLKPENIMFGDDKRVVVTDFGLSRLLTPDTGVTNQLSSLSLSVNPWVGTPPYTSPEQALGRPAGPAADVYALCTIAYEMLAGDLPFMGENPQETLVQIATEPAPPPSQRNPDMDPRVERVLLKGLSKRPEDRFATASDFVEALAQAAYVTRRGPVFFTLFVEGTPVGASVTIDDRDVGSLPCVGPGLTPGDHAVRVDAAGFQSYGRIVTVPMVEPLRVELVPELYELKITGEPTGAEVWIDNRLRGTLQCTVPDLTGGTHVVTVSMRGYLSHSEQVTLPGSSPLSVALLPEDCSLTIDGGAELTNVTLDGNPVGALPQTLSGLTPGAHRVTATRPDGSVTAETISLPRVDTIHLQTDPPGGYILQIDGSPIGAAILVDGQPMGLVPDRVSGLRGGTHVVKLASPGYVSAQTTVTLPTSEPLTLSLKPISFNLSISGRPKGAEVFVDGVRVGALPLDLSGQLAGEYQIEVRQPGYATFSQLVTVPRDERVVVELKEEGVDLQIVGNPVGAAVKVDGKATGALPLILNGLKPGKHTIEVAADGFVDRKLTVVLPSEPEVDATLSPQLYELSVKGGPKGAQVAVDGQGAGTLPGTIRDLNAGQHVLTISHPGRLTETRTVDIPGTKSIDVQLDEPRYTLDVRGRPLGAQVFINKKNVGVLPCAVKTLKPGPVHITVRNPGFRTVEHDVEIPVSEPVVVALEAEGIVVGPPPPWWRSKLLVAFGMGAAAFLILAALSASGVLPKNSAIAAILDNLIHSTPTPPQPPPARSVTPPRSPTRPPSPTPIPTTGPLTFLPPCEMSDDWNDLFGAGLIGDIEILNFVDIDWESDCIPPTEAPYFAAIVQAKGQIADAEMEDIPSERARRYEDALAALYAAEGMLPDRPEARDLIAYLHAFVGFDVVPTPIPSPTPVGSLTPTVRTTTTITATPSVTPTATRTQVGNPTSPPSSTPTHTVVPTSTSTLTPEPTRTSTPLPPTSTPTSEPTATTEPAIVGNAPSAPDTFRAGLLGPTSVRLDWNNRSNNNEDGFVISIDGGAAITLQAGATTYIDNNAVPGATRRYVIYAFNEFGRSPAKEIPVVIPGPEAPEAPGSTPTSRLPTPTPRPGPAAFPGTVNAIALESGRIQVDWSGNFEGPGEFTIKDDQGNTITSAAGTRTRVFGANAGQQRCYTISWAGSASSAPACATTKLNTAQ